MTNDFDEQRRPSRLMIALLTVGGLLLVAVLVLLMVALAGSGASTPTAAPTPSATPSSTTTTTPTPTPTPSATEAPTPPPSPIRDFASSTTEVNCTAGGAVPLTFTWDTAGTTVSFGIGTEIADAEPYETGLSPVGTITVDYQCGQEAGWQQYAIAVFLGSEVIARDTIVVSE